MTGSVSLLRRWTQEKGVRIFVLLVFLLAGAEAETGRVLRADGSTVTYYLNRPDTERYPLVAILQGSECLKVSHKYLEHIERLNGQGVAVLRVEKPGLDDSVKPGDCPPEYLRLNTPQRRVLDLLLVLAELRRVEAGYNGSLALAGGSEGAMIVSLTAPLCQDLVALVLFSGGGGTIFGDEVLAGMRKGMEAAGADQAAISARLQAVAEQLAAIREEPLSSKEWLSDGELARNTYRWWAQAWDLQMALPLLRVEAPILSLHGVDDESVLVAGSYLLAEKMKDAGRENFQLRTYQGGHGPPTEVITESLDWIVGRF